MRPEELTAQSDLLAESGHRPRAAVVGTACPLLVFAGRHLLRFSATRAAIVAAENHKSAGIVDILRLVCPRRDEALARWGWPVAKNFRRELAPVHGRGTASKKASLAAYGRGLRACAEAGVNG